MLKRKEKSVIDIAYSQYVGVFQKYKSDKMYASNEFPVGHSSRIEHDFSEQEKAHLDLLKTKVEIELSKTKMELSKSSEQSNERFRRAIMVFNVVMAVFTLVLACSAVVDLIN